MNPDDERAAFWSAVHTVDDRVTALEATVRTRNDLMRDAIQAAVRDAMPAALLTDQEHAWVKLAIQREGQMISYRRAVIEKSLVGLAWLAILGIGMMLREWAIAHGVWKP